MRKALSNILIIAGILFILIPIAANCYTKHKHQKMIEEWMNANDLTDEASETAQASYHAAQTAMMDMIEGETRNITNYTPEISAGMTETSKIFDLEHKDPTPTPIPLPTKKPLMSKKEIEKNMIGTITIDKIDVRLPILNGIDEESLRVAAGRMPETGLPDEIGNMVLAGHRSYTFGKYFNRLDELETGDEIVIKTKNKEIKYTVFKSLIVEPTDFSIMNRNDTHKVLTLFTCHPVAIASHRLVVQAVQIN